MKKTSTAYILLFAGIFSLCIFSLLFYQRIKVLMNSYELVNRSMQVSLQADKLFLSLRDVAANYREYLLLKKDSSLTELKNNLNQYPAALQVIKKLEAGNTSQLDNLNTIGLLADDFNAYMHNAIGNKNINPLTDTVFNSIRFKLAALRNSIKTLSDNENKILQQRDDVLSEHIYTTPLFLLVLSFVSIVIIVYAFSSIIKQIKKNKELELNEMRLKESEIKLEQLVKERAAELTIRNHDLNEAQRLAHLGSWDWNIITNALEWTDELYRIYGVKPQNFILTFESYISLCHPADREFTNKTIQEALDLCKPFDFYHRIITPDGSIRNIHGRGNVYTNEKNEPVRMAGTAQDITDTIRTQNRINELNQTFNFAEQTSLIGSFRYNFSSGDFAYSDNLYRILGFKPGEFEPTLENFIKFIHPEDLKLVSTAEKFNEANISTEYLFRVFKKDNSMIHVRNTGMFITEENERIYIGTLQDVTAQHNKELQLLEQNTALENMNKELASFSYVASHDLQEPLRKIKMFTRRLAEKELDNLSEHSKEYFMRIENAATRMQQLIEDLLSYSRTNTTHAHFELTDMHKLLEDVSDNLKERITQTNTVIEFAALQKASVIPFQFQQLFTNLITNSIKFTNSNTNPHIRISQKLINGEIIPDAPAAKKCIYHHFVLSDNGIGFEPQYNEQIFGLFQRLHGRHEFEGTGIGLAICKKIVENHNGFITASGIKNKGATFNIYIPVEQNKDLN